MKLLREMTEELSFLKESPSTDSGIAAPSYYIEGIFVQADIENRNGRMYPSDVIGEAVEKYTAQFIDKKRAFGELGHPNNPSLNLDRTSHLITELKREGNNWIGKAKIISTPMGEIVKNFIDEGCTLGISSRGLGSVKNVKGTNVVQDDFFFVTAGDIVSDPSAPDAFLNNIVEGVEWVMRQDGSWVEINMPGLKARADEIVRTSKHLKEEKEKQFLKLFQDFLQKL